MSVPEHFFIVIFLPLFAIKTDRIPLSEIAKKG